MLSHIYKILQFNYEVVITNEKIICQPNEKLRMPYTKSIFQKPKLPAFSLSEIHSLLSDLSYKPN